MQHTPASGGDGGSGGGRDWRSLHLWQIQWVRDLLVIAAVLGLINLGYRLSIVTVPMLLALLLAYLVEPLVRRLTTASGRVFSRPGVAVMVLLLSVLMLVVPLTVGVAFAVVQGVNYAGVVARNVGLVQEAVQHPKDDARLKAVPVGGWHWIAHELIHIDEQEAASRAGEGAPPAGEPAIAPVSPNANADKPGIRAAADLVLTWVKSNAGAIGKQAIGTGAEAVGFAFRGVASLGTLVFGGLLTAFFFYFFCTGWGRVLAFWESLIPERKRGRAIVLLREMDRVIAGFIRGRLTIAFILGIIITTAYWLIGVPMPLIIGPIVGALVLVPFGQLIGLPIAIIALALQPSPVGFQSAWWWIVFAPVGVYILGQVLDDYLLNPMIQGKHTGMDTPTILFASLAGGALAGVYGLIIAIPTAACLKILLKEVFWPRFKAWGQGKERDMLPISHEDAGG